MGDRHVFEDSQDERGSRRYADAYLDGDGRLVLSIHDLGPVVEDFFGCFEYESFTTFSVEQTARLRADLGEDLIAAIAQRFASQREVAEYAAALVGSGEHWSRTGD
ncbi:hypothetical protein BI335_03305 [Enemella evansiae]|uniref:hypothetical protein n=1 Tax=Enemella evansiae TaxID=2016499 RepID=UPI000B9726A5|nr:hypothetical protein [Enemella evansiae]OYO20566.1 hypothetical protein BI335_03305 [Enemella evansiae]